MANALPEDDPIARALELAMASTAGARPLSETELAAPQTEEDAADDPAPVVAALGLKVSLRPLRRPAKRLDEVTRGGSAMHRVSP